MPIDWTDFITRPDMGQTNYGATLDMSVAPKQLMEAINNLFPHYAGGYDATVTKEKPTNGAVADTGGHLGNKIRAGNLGHRITPVDNKTGAAGPLADFEVADQNSDLAAVMHELMHARQAASKEKGLLKAQLGADWKAMLKDAQEAEFPSVGTQFGGGDNLEEFLATAVTLKSLAQQNIKLTRGPLRKAQDKLPELEKKYPWLPTYIQTQSMPEVPSVRTWEPSMLDTVVNLITGKGPKK